MACGRNRRRDGHSSGTPVARRIKQPTRMTGPDGPKAKSEDLRLCVIPIRFCSRWGLPCRCRCRQRGALLPHRFTLTPTNTQRGRGGLFSVALSLRTTRCAKPPPPDVIRHRSSMEPGLSSPAAFRHWRGAAVRPTDAGRNGVRGSRAVKPLMASGKKEARTCWEGTQARAGEWGGIGTPDQARGEAPPVLQEMSDDQAEADGAGADRLGALLAGAGDGQPRCLRGWRWWSVLVRHGIISG